MGADADLDWPGAVRSALEWWHDAGVDTLVDDAPRDWLAALPAPVASTAPVTAAAAPAMPDDLAEFLVWRGGGDAPEAGWRGRLHPATGPHDARLMVLLDCPDIDEGGVLLGDGPAGRLFGRMLAAIGLSRDEVHLAATWWRRPPPGRIPPAIEEQARALARRHVELVAPQRLLLMGDAAARAMIGTNTAAARETAHRFAHKDGATTMVASFHPRFLLERPATKAEAWRDLQLLTGE